MSQRTNGRVSLPCDTVDEHRALFESLGGLPETTVQNTEWLYMLEEDTRHSLAIEGYFASEKDVEAALKGGKSSLEITNYFRTAQTVYDQALQYYRDTTIRLDVPMVRHIHSELFRDLDKRRGDFRKGGIQIRGAPVHPPEYDIDMYTRAALEVMEEALRTLPILPALARAHTLFESIHPFPDGNGRVGRILLNYLAVSKGYPPLLIKGTSQQERDRYYSTLEAGDTGFHSGFPDPTPDALRARLEQGDFASLSLLLCEGLLPRLDRMIVLTMEEQEKLSELPEVATQLNIKEAALRQRIHRGTHLAIKRGKKLYSHPHLGL